MPTALGSVADQVGGGVTKLMSKLVQNPHTAITTRGIINQGTDRRGEPESVFPVRQRIASLAVLVVDWERKAGDLSC